MTNDDDFVEIGEGKKDGDLSHESTMVIHSNDVLLRGINKNWNYYNLKIFMDKSIFPRKVVFKNS